MSDESRSTRHILLLAPALATVPAVFTQAVLDRGAYGEHLARLQRLRGRIYLEDGAIEQWQLTEDGRHFLSSDEKSWHVLTKEGDEVVACARLLVHPPASTFADLGVATSSQARCPEWGLKLQQSVSATLQRTRTEGINFAEAGGWALTPELRCTTEALNVALASYALGHLLGGCVCLSTATVRHSSASILRRLGGSSFEWDGEVLPPYFDAQYQCQMEIVRFDSRHPNPKYRFWIDALLAELPQARVLCAEAGAMLAAPGLMSLADALGTSIPVAPAIPHQATEAQAMEDLRQAVNTSTKRKSS